MAAKKKEKKAPKAAPVKKERKAYPSYDERIAAAEKKIAALEGLIADRTKLIEKTQKVLDSRKAALAKNEQALAKTRAKRERLIANQERKSLTPEQRAEKRKASIARAREVKKAEKAKLEALALAISDKGVSIDEVLAQIGK